MKRELIHEQRDNMGSNISNIITKGETLEEVIRQIIKGDEWGTIYTVKGIGWSIFNKSTEKVEYSKGRIIKNTFPDSELKKIVVGGKCWHSWGLADYYLKVRARRIKK